MAVVQAVLRPVFLHHDADHSKPCMPSTFVAGASFVSVVSSASVFARAASVNTLHDDEDSWLDVDFDNTGDIVVESAAPSSSHLGTHRAHAEPMADDDAIGPAAVIVDSWEDLWSDDDHATTSNLPSLDVVVSCRNTCLHIALVASEQSSRVRAHSAPPRPMSHCVA